MERQQQQHPRQRCHSQDKASSAQLRCERRRHRSGGFMQRILVGELRSYPTSFESMAMLDTVAAALIAGVVNSARVYPGAKVLSLTALDHDSYPAASDLCTMVCVVRWCGPPGVTWVATDLSFDRTRVPACDIIAEGTLPDGLVVGFHRSGLLCAPRMSSEASRPMPPPPCFVVAALRPRLHDVVQVAPDGSISRRCADPSGRCHVCDTVWRTPIHIVGSAAKADVGFATKCEPVRSDAGLLSHNAVPPCVTRAIAKAIASSLASPKTGALNDSAITVTARPDRRQPNSLRREAPSQPISDGEKTSPKQGEPSGGPLTPSKTLTRLPTSSFSAPSASLPTASVPQPFLPTHQSARPPTPPTASSRRTPRVDSVAPPSCTPTKNTVEASPPVAVHPRCASTLCAASSRAATGKVVRIECTAGCRVTLHRACWRAMDLEPDDDRACLTPDCWGLWARMTSTRRALDGSETPLYVEWSRVSRRSLNLAKTARGSYKRRSTSPAVTGGAPVGTRVSAAAAGDPTIKAQKNTGKAVTPCVAVDAGRKAMESNETLHSDDRETVQDNGDTAYVGRIRRRRVLQKQGRPRHRRADPVKALVCLVARDANQSSPVVAGGAHAESPVAEQEATRAKRRLATVVAACDGVDVHAVRKPRASTTRPTRAKRHSDKSAGDDKVGDKAASPNNVQRVAVGDASVATPPVCEACTDNSDAMPLDLSGAWAAFFGWDRVPPSLVPEMPAVRPSTAGLWSLPPLLAASAEIDAPCHPAAVWSCFCHHTAAA